jgi:hypothetical protein
MDAFNAIPRRDRDAATNAFDAMESASKIRLGMPVPTEYSVQVVAVPVAGQRLIPFAGSMTALFVAVLASLRATIRPRIELAAEILALRHQLAVLQRTTTKRPRLRPIDRLLWMLLSCGTSARCTATCSATSRTITSGELTSRWTRMLPSRELPNRQPAAQPSQSHTSAVCITTTNVAPPDRCSRHHYNGRTRRTSAVVHPPQALVVLGDEVPRVRCSWGCVLATLITDHQRLRTVTMEFLVGTPATVSSERRCL